MAKRMVLLVGTNKGLFLYASDNARQAWSLNGPYLPGWEINSVLGHGRHGPHIFAGTSHADYGATIRVSEDFGETWTQIERGPAYSKESGFRLNRIWLVEH